MLNTVVYFLSLALHQAPIIIDEQFEQQLVSEQAVILITSESISVVEALEKLVEGEFQPPPEKGLVFPTGKVFYWVKYTVKNTSGGALQLYTEVRNAHINNIQLYEYTIGDDALQTSGMTGDYQAFSSRQASHRFFVFDSRLEAGETREFLMYADKYNESIKIPIILRSENNFNEVTLKEILILGAYIGIYLIIIICLVILNISSFKPLHFLLLIYVVSFVLFAVSTTGLGFQYLWHNFPTVNSLSRPFLSSVATLSFLMFCSYFFELKTRGSAERKTHKGVSLFLVTNGLLYSGYCFLAFIGSSLQNTNVLKLLQVGFLLFVAYFIFLPIYYAIKDFKWKYIAFLCANMGFIIVISANVAEEYGLLESTFFLENMILAALVIDFSILSSIIGIDFYSIKVDNRRLASSLDQAVLDGGRQFIEGQQNERVRLAQEVHDGAGSRLSSLQMRLSVLATTDEDLKLKLVNETKLIAQDIRRFSHNLSSVILEEYGFIHAVEELLYSIEENNAQFSIDFSYSSAQISAKNIERELYFICLELINNAVKYSNGNKIAVSFDKTESFYSLSVNDNGKGYNREKVSSGLGLKGIDWRVKLLNGEFNISFNGNVQHHSINIPHP